MEIDGPASPKHVEGRPCVPFDACGICRARVRAYRVARREDKRVDAILSVAGGDLELAGFLSREDLREVVRVLPPESLRFVESATAGLRASIAGALVAEVRSRGKVRVVDVLVALMRVGMTVGEAEETVDDLVNSRAVERDALIGQPVDVMILVPGR